MRKLNRFWSGLEALPGLASVPAEWERVWGEEAENGKTFLRSTGCLATSYPCPYPGGDGCPRGVVIHGEQDIVAVCRCVPRECDDVKLTRPDITILRLDWLALGTAIALGLGFTVPTKPAREALPSTARIGWHHLSGGRRAAVYLTIQHEFHAIEATVSRLLVHADSSFILASPTAALCQSDGGELLRTGVLFLPLNECLVWEGTGKFAATDRARALLADFEAAASVLTIPSRKRDRQARAAQVCPPPGTRWDELRLVTEDHFLTYEVRDEQGRWGFAEAGFEDRRRRNIPDSIWELLLAFSRGDGSLREEALREDLKRNLRQQVSTLRRRLHGLFRISGKPITKKRGEPYCTAFRIRPKEGVTITVPADCSWSQISIVEMRSGAIRFIIETKERFVAFGDLRRAEFSRDAAERPRDSTVEHTMRELGLLQEDGEPTRAGRSLREVLRASGRLPRQWDDDGMIELCGHLCQLTGIAESPFEFISEGGGWCARFQADSQAGRM